MQVLVVLNGEYGRRHARNLRENGPDDWSIDEWCAPSVLPPVVDYPEDHLPGQMTKADLVLSVAEDKGVAQLLPAIARLTGASAVLAPVDREEWLPRGLAGQLHRWLREQNVGCATPKPFCSLTERDYLTARGRSREVVAPITKAFAQHFGRPALRLCVTSDGRRVSSISVERDACCGCARSIADELVGRAVDDVVQQAGLLHHHYPCLASMGVDTDFDDTLMHVSGNILKDEVASCVEPYVHVSRIVPRNRAD